MPKVRFVGLDVHAETIAVAVAEVGGEVRVLGVIPNRLESIRKLVQKLKPVEICAFATRPGPPDTFCVGSCCNSESPVK